MSSSSSSDSSTDPVPVRVVGKMNLKERERLGLLSISRDVALEVAWNIIGYWTPRNNTYSFTYGCLAASIPSILLPVSYTQVVRNIYRLHSVSYGKYLYTIPSMILAGYLSGFGHLMIANDILVGDTKCSSCLLTRSLSIQMAAGIGCPLFVSSLGYYNYLSNLSMKIPRIGTREFLKWIKLLGSRYKGPLGIAITAQCISTTLLMKLQQKQWAHINEELKYRMDEKLAHKVPDFSIDPDEYKLNELEIEDHFEKVSTYADKQFKKLVM